MTYNAIFTVDGEEYAKVPTKVDDQIVAPKDPSKEGYTFAGWRPSVGVMGTADATFEAVFTAAGNTAYTVNTYVMGTDGTYGEPTSEKLTGTTGSTATYAPEAREASPLRTRAFFPARSRQTEALSSRYSTAATSTPLPLKALRIPSTMARLFP